jgi:hypothetical protein
MPTVGYNPGPPSGPSGVLDPWFTLKAASQQCSVLAHYAAAAGESGAAAAGPVAAATCSSAGAAATIWSAGPLPSEALHLIAKAAGVHIYLPGSSTPTADGVEAAGAALMLRGGSNTTAAEQKTVLLPPRDGGYRVLDESETVVCEGCDRFAYSLGPGDAAMYRVVPV